VQEIEALEEKVMEYGKKRAELEEKVKSLEEEKVSLLAEIEALKAIPELEAKRVCANNAFYFFTDIGQYTDRCSTSLADFCNTIWTIDIRSVEFHFKREDFAMWIKETLGDNELANDINRISKTIRGEELRTILYQTVETRLTKLKKLQASESLGRSSVW
jgi:hypothetical protein